MKAIAASITISSFGNPLPKLHLLPPLTVSRRNLAEEFELVQAFACSLRDSAQGIFRNMNRQSGLLAQQAIEPAQERAPARQHQPAVDQVG
jgi:hypothetical protein